MHKALFNSKLKAFAIHFAISLVIFSVLLYFILFHWYPFPFFTTDGGWQGIRLVGFIDLVLGPLFTFIVFNPITKTARHLKTDLSIIAIFQIAALSWGTWVIHNERPYLVVFSDRTFYALPLYQVKETGLGLVDIRKFGNTPPIKVFTNIPIAPDKRLNILSKTIAKEIPLHFFGEYYQKFDEKSLEKLTQSSINMGEYIRSRNVREKQYYDDFLRNNTTNINDLLFFPLSARYGKFIVVFNKLSLKFVEVLNITPPVIDPWEGTDSYIKKLQQ